MVFGKNAANPLYIPTSKKQKRLKAKKTFSITRKLNAFEASKGPKMIRMLPVITTKMIAVPKPMQKLDSIMLDKFLF